MDNVAATRSLCNAICSTFYPDLSTIELALFNEGIEPRAEAIPKDAQVFRVAARLVVGYVEGSRSEGGLSTSVASPESIRQSLMVWCANYGIDADEVLGDSIRLVQDGSSLW